ncbi:MAG: 2-oxo acid dehydrogenase subunit E2 [Anaerolineae bacterium]|jgi:pyruvate dehydrogenase E2 component (dihydrolipoamide acetyltransferase)|nr:2-oxo acid dehydrogenase subunit E2 [Anaerolineae bacterium]
MSEAIKLTTDGMLLNWLKAVGDSIKAGEIIAEFEADKATVEVESTVTGVVLELKADIGEELKEGAIIAIVGASGEATTSQSAPATNGSAAPKPTSAPTPNGSSTTPEGRVKASPLARNIAADKGIDLTGVAGTGPGGRIVKADVENYQPSATPTPTPVAKVESTPVAVGGRNTYGAVPTEDVEIIEISRMRRAIADATITTKQMTPHFYVTVSVDVAPLLKLRSQLNANLEGDAKISVNDLVVKAVALALRKFPNLNSHYYGDKIVRHQRIHIGIAVALPNNGLLNVVAKDADKMALSTMAVTNKAMFERAREGKVKPDDIKGATFTVSNLGPYQVDSFAAIISSPEAGILAVSSAKKVPIVLEDGTIGVGERMNLTLSVDHRVSDGAEGAQFMVELRSLIENPMRLLV